MTSPVLEPLTPPAATKQGTAFRLDSEFQPSGDQPQAIAELVEGLGRSSSEAK